MPNVFEGVAARLVLFSVSIVAQALARYVRLELASLAMTGNLAEHSTVLHGIVVQSSRRTYRYPWCYSSLQSDSPVSPQRPLGALQVAHSSHGFVS